MNHKGTISIITDKYIFRRFNKNDIKDIKRKYRQDESFEKLFKIYNIDFYNKKNYYDWIITLSNNELIGEVYVVRYDDLLKTVQINFLLNNKYYESINELLYIICDFLFNQVSCNRIEFRTNINIYNIHYMNYEGLLKEAEIINKKFIDVKLYSKVKSEFNENNNRC